MRTAEIQPPHLLARTAPSGAAENCRVISLERVAFGQAWALQQRLGEALKRGQAPHTLLFLEHPPVITLGRNAKAEHLLSSPEALADAGIEIIETNRGGDVTFHGPGQLVGYCIFDLSRIRKDVVWYVRTLERALVEALRETGLPAEARPGLTGVWVEGAKIASIGVHISRWITSHGFALNIDTDLSCFRHIIPCGIEGCRMTSVNLLSGKGGNRPLLERAIASRIGELFGFDMVWSPRELGKELLQCP